MAIDHDRARLYIVTQENRFIQYEKNQLTGLTRLLPSDLSGNTTALTIAVDPQNTGLVEVAGTMNVDKTDASVKHSTNAGKTLSETVPMYKKD